MSGFSMDQAGNNLDQTIIVTPGVIKVSDYPSMYSGSGLIGIDGQANMQESMLNLDTCFCVLAAV